MIDFSRVAIQTHQGGWKLGHWLQEDVDYCLLRNIISELLCKYEKAGMENKVQMIAAAFALVRGSELTAIGARSKWCTDPQHIQKQ